MTTSIQQLRTQAEAGIANDVTTANGLLKNIAQINTKLEGIGSTPDATAAALEDQRDQDITQLSQLMNVNVVHGTNNQIALYTGTGLQLVNAGQASVMTFGNAGTLSAQALWSATPSLDGAGTITLTAPGGATMDMISDGAISSGEIGAYLQMRDTVLPQAQTQLDEFANQMSQALSNQTVSGTAVTSGGLNGFKVDVGSMVPGNSMQFTYTDSGNVQHTVTVVDTPAGMSLPQTGSATKSEQLDDRHRFFRRHKHRGRPAQSGVRLERAILESVGHPAASRSIPAAPAAWSMRCRRPRP